MLKDIYNAVGVNAAPTVVLVLFILSVCVDVSKLPLNPWKWIGRLGTSALHTVGKALTSDIKADLKDLHCRIESIEITQKAEYKQTKRRNILRFADECRIDVKHSKEMFDNVMSDIDDYEKLCTETKDPNHVLQEAVRIIEHCYHKCMTENSFL